MELALGALVVAAALGFVIYPLLRPRLASTPGGPDADRQQTLAERRQAIYREIVDLEFDHRVGKLDEADYRELSDACLARAASLLAEADAEQTLLDERAEREIAAMREALHAAAARHDADKASR